MWSIASLAGHLWKSVPARPGRSNRLVAVVLVKSCSAQACARRKCRAHSAPPRQCHRHKPHLLECPLVSMDGFCEDIIKTLEGALPISSLDAVHTDALVQLISVMKAQSLQPDWGASCDSRSLSPAEIAGLYFDIGLQISSLQCRDDWTQTQAPVDITRAIRQAFTTASSCLMHGTLLRECSCQECPLDAFRNNVVRRLVDVARGLGTQSTQRPSTPVGFRNLSLRPLDWAYNVAAKIHSIAAGRLQAEQAPSIFGSLQCSNSSLQFSKSASAGSAGIATGGTFHSPNVSSKGFRPISASSHSPSHLSGPSQQPVPDHSSHAAVRAHLRNILGQAVLNGRLQEELRSTGHTGLDLESGAAESPEMRPACFSNAESHAAVPALVLPGILDMEAEIVQDVEGREPESPEDVSSPAILPQCAPVTQPRSCANITPECSDAAHAPVPCAQDPRKQAAQPAVLKRLRPWEEDASHRADVLIRHLDQVGKGQGTAGIERCLYADGVLPLWRDPQHPQLNERHKRLAERSSRSNAANAAPGHDESGADNADALSTSLSKLLSHSAKNIRQPDVQQRPGPKPSTRQPAKLANQASSQDPRHAQVLVDKKHAEKNEINGRPSLPARPGPSALECPTKLPQVVSSRGIQKPSGSGACAAGIYSQSFKKVSSDAADKHRLYRSSQSLPTIKVKQRSPPDIPMRKWRPLC